MAGMTRISRMMMKRSMIGLVAFGVEILMMIAMTMLKMVGIMVMMNLVLSMTDMMMMIVMIDESDGADFGYNCEW